MIKTKKELLKLIPKYQVGRVPLFSNKTLYFYIDNNTFFYDRGNVPDHELLLLTTKEAIDLYNRLNFQKDFLDML